MVNEARLVEQFLSLVRIDSETKHEERISEELILLFTGLGLSVVQDDAKARTGHGAKSWMSA